MNFVPKHCCCDHCVKSDLSIEKCVQRLQYKKPLCTIVKQTKRVCMGVSDGWQQWIRIKNKGLLNSADERYINNAHALKVSL